MNDHKGMSAMIVAGYKNLMQKCFMERNEGLARRFPIRIDLPLSSTDELFNIFLKNVVDKSCDSLKSLQEKYDKKQKEFEKEAKLVTEPRQKMTLADQIYKVSDDIDDTKAKIKSLTKRKQTYYNVMKPTFMMFHMDTTYGAIELLRKYLLIIKLRELEDIKFDEIYSYTIVTHVLICLLQTQLQRNLIRRHFYAELFNFEDANLSFFKAQAGEMGLISDACTKTIDARVKGKQVDSKDEADLLNTYFQDKGIEVKLYEQRKADGDVEVAEAAEAAEAAVAQPADAEAEADANKQRNKKLRGGVSNAKAVKPDGWEKKLKEASQAAEAADWEDGWGSEGVETPRVGLNQDLLNKSGGPETPRPEAKPTKRYYLEITKKGAIINEFQEKINAFLNLETLFKWINDSSSPTPSKKPEEKTRSRQNVEREVKEEQNIEGIPDIFIEKKLEKLAEKIVSEDPQSYDNFKDQAKTLIKSVRKTAPTTEPKQEAKGSPADLPSLWKLFQMLHNEDKVNKLCEHMVNIYFKKNTIKYVSSILDKIETDFPIHLVRTDLDFEKTALMDKNHYSKTLEKVKEYNHCILEKKEANSLKNPKFKEWEELDHKGKAQPVTPESKKSKQQADTLKKDILWEDISIF
jgi:hypothetical protein